MMSHSLLTLSSYHCARQSTRHLSIFLLARKLGVCVNVSRVIVVVNIHRIVSAKQGVRVSSGIGVG